MDTKTETKPAAEPKANISFQLVGAPAERFLAYKKKQNLKQNAEIGRKLMLDQLDQVFPESQAS
jgi:hypothetical protein